MIRELDLPTVLRKWAQQLSDVLTQWNCLLLKCGDSLVYGRFWRPPIVPVKIHARVRCGWFNASVRHLSASREAFNVTLIYSLCAYGLR